ncbi:MAG: Gfo/Idh/MocA family oxidoreductase [Actinomycetota bacterium]|nr:Gfo/Idh/MocA family oxidoreductase [Actinomycetota bacterium]MDQ3720711.1 Gfo/Idh/MocA family oxidoreductase [Actinomycetota bacterium]
MTSPIRIAVAGTGYGTRALSVYSDLPEFEPVGVWSRREEPVTEAAQDAGIELATTDLEELLDADGLEAVHVAAPVFMHGEVVHAALRRGLHVICEKPVARDLTEARGVAAAVEEAGVVCAVNFTRRYHDTRRRLLELVPEVVGRPRLVEVSLVHTDHATPDARPFTWVQDAELGGGRLQGYGIHDLDLLLLAFGEVESVAAALEVQVSERSDGERTRRVTAEDTYALLLRMREGGLAAVTMTATARHGRGDLVELHGDRGTIRLDAERRLWYGQEGEELRCEGPLEADSKRAFAQLARNFHGAVREGRSPEPSMDEGLRVQALMDAVRRAEAERRWVEVEDWRSDGS